MDIEEFYEGDDRRRASAEVEFGTEWLDQGGRRYELSWVEDTGELYVMREPAPPAWEDPFGGIYVKVDDAPVEGMDVVVLGTVQGRDAVERLMEGWRSQVGNPDSVAWLVERLRGAGLLHPDAGTGVPE